MNSLPPSGQQGCHAHTELFARFYDRHLGTFLVAFRIRPRYDLARSWLYGIAGSLIGRQRRSEVRAPRALARTGQDPVAASWSESWVEDTDRRPAAQGGRPAPETPRARVRVPHPGPVRFPS